MPFEIKLNGPPIGYSASAVLNGEAAQIAVQGFLCLDEPTTLLAVLESFHASVLAFLPPEGRVSPDMIRHAAAVIRPNGDTTVWQNELSFVAQALVRSNVTAGQPVSREDLADIVRLDLGVDVPADAGFALAFSVGWERAFFFDFAPLAGGGTRKVDLSVVLGQHYTYLLHRRRLLLTEEEWARLIDEDWFPFILLPQQTIDLMLGMLRQGRSVDLILPAIAEAVEERLDTFPQKVAARASFESHRPFLATAVDRYRAGDFLSCVSVLYPRVEGLLRTILRPGGRIGHKRLTSLVIDQGSKRLSSASPLLGGKFEEYMVKRFLADFDPGDPAGLNRHTALHGVARISEFTQKRALLGFLILHQLLFFDDKGSAEGEHGNAPE